MLIELKFNIFSTVDAENYSKECDNLLFEIDRFLNKSIIFDELMEVFYKFLIQTKLFKLEILQLTKNTDIHFKEIDFASFFF